MAILIIKHRRFYDESPDLFILEGFVYMKQKYMQGNKIWKFWLEIIIYSVLFALPAASLLF